MFVLLQKAKHLLTFSLLCVQLHRTAAIPSGLTDDKLYEVAEAINPDNWYRVGVSLGVPSETIDKIIVDNPHNIEIQIFKMLRTWYKMQPTDVAEAEAKLKSVLNKFKNPKAISILENTTEDESVQTMDYAANANLQ
jgi:hypothetical protein